ncbi:MAG: DUF167 domain-containing protein [Holosporaceae bacterium]|jgi:uncharacterized protein (TIGR00251 family)|nr:DUF167 domain-containing protein [Holosporaceae bacterium]
MLNNFKNDLCYEKSKNGIYLKVKVVAKSSRNEVVGLRGDRIRVAVRAVPQNGEANEALESVIASFFGVGRSCCGVTFGHRSSQKIVFVAADIESKIKATFYPD